MQRTKADAHHEDRENNVATMPRGAVTQVVITVFDDDSVHTGVHPPHLDDGEAMRAIMAAADSFGIGDGETADLTCVHEDVCVDVVGVCRDWN